MKSNVSDFRKGSRVVRGEDYRPEVSVIIPTYNRARFIERAIRSVLNQTYQNFEIIVVDDASTDDTEERVRRLLTNGTRFKYVRHDINRGAGAARNTGIKNAAGEYIALLDSDDEWLPEKLERQLQVFKESRDEKLGLVYCGVVLIKDNQKVGERLSKEKGYVFEKLLERNFVGGGSIPMIKREAFDNVGIFDESKELRNGGGEDSEMWLRISKYYNFGFVSDFLVRYYIHSSSIMLTFKERDRARTLEYRINKFREDYERKPEIWSEKLFRIANWYCHAGDMKKGRKVFRDSIKVNPLNINSYFGFFLSFFGSNYYRKVFRSYLYLKRRNDSPYLNRLRRQPTSSSGSQRRRRSA